MNRNNKRVPEIIRKAKWTRIKEICQIWQKINKNKINKPDNMQILYYIMLALEREYTSTFKNTFKKWWQYCYRTIYRTTYQKQTMSLFISTFMEKNSYMPEMIWDEQALNKYARDDTYCTYNWLVWFSYFCDFRKLLSIGYIFMSSIKKNQLSFHFQKITAS